MNGQELTALAPKELRQARRKIGMIFQHFNLMKSRTVYSNVASSSARLLSPKKNGATK